MDRYEKRLFDAFGDAFTVRAQDGDVLIRDENPADYSVADMAFTPQGALMLARRLIRAAEVAYEQEMDASGL